MKRKIFQIQSYNAAGFGDYLSAAVFVKILNDNNIPAVLDWPKIHDLVDCPKIEDIKDPENVEFISHTAVRHHRKESGLTFYSDLVKGFKNGKNVTKDININVDSVPIIYKDIPEIEGVDIALVTKSAPFGPYRDWPYFDELKLLFKNNGISYIDLTKNNIKNFEFLNYVKKSKIYLGLETGSSHYASSLIKGKGFIIQSGYCNFEYWAGHYHYEKIENRMHCAPCWKRRDCEEDHQCMKGISAQEVFEIVASQLYAKKTNKFMSNTLLAPHKFDLLRRHSISTSGIEGDIIEVGLFRGGSFAMLCEINPHKHIYGFDTFEGLPPHSPEDNKHVEGEFSDTNKEAVENLVAHLDNHTIQKGRFPQDLSIDLSDKKFSLAHIDVDLYQEHINVLNYLYDKVVENGRIVFDDYNHANCLGAKKAVDLFFKDKPEEIITSNTSQAYVIKK